MSQNLRNQPGEREGSSARGSGDDQERKRFDKFESMNYEQIRKPYHPQNTGNRNRDDRTNGDHAPKK